MARQTQRDCDVLVIGSGAGGLATAVVAAQHGLDVIVVEKAPVFGGTTAFSGGVLWIPGNRHCPGAAADTREAARQYLQNETGNFFNAEAVDAFLDHAPEMLDWFEAHTAVRFVPTLYPDYHPTVPGGVDVGRSVLAAPFDITELGADYKRLRRPLATITFLGMMFNSSNAELKHFFNATKSATSAAYVARRLASHTGDMLRHGQGVKATSGNALAARLAKSAFDLSVPILTGTPARRLLIEGGAVQGAVVGTAEGETTIRARRGTVLAAGGFPHDLARIARAYPHVARGAEHHSPTPEVNTGDGIALAEQAGARCDIRLAAAAAWMPVSLVPRRGGKPGVFPHLLDRYKPGIIAVTRNGQRFCNESESYHDFGAALIAACEGQAETACWLVCDHRAIRTYGLGHAKPAPVPLWGPLANGYIQKGATLAELAARTGTDAAGLEAAIAAYNKGAVHGQDPQFGRGTTAFNRYLADPGNRPNPCVAPIQKGPFYALKIVMGDLGSFDGLATDTLGRVLDTQDQPIAGLYAVGNDRASVMGGNYPGAGITLGPIMTFAYLTGRHLARLTS